MTLTKQWEKGELPDGLYYCKLACFNYEPTIAKCKSGCIGLASFSKNEEVLAPVPSYEEWQELKEASDRLSKLMFKSLMNRFVKADEEREKLAEENQQLKELLKKWMHFYPIILYEHEDTLKTKDIVELFDKTREVLK